MPMIALHRAWNADPIDARKLSQPSGVLILRILAKRRLEDRGQISSGVFAVFTRVQKQDISQRRIGSGREQAEAFDGFEPRIHEGLGELFPAEIAHYPATP